MSSNEEHSENVRQPVDLPEVTFAESQNPFTDETSPEHTTDTPEVGTVPPPSTVPPGGHWLHPSSVVFDAISNGRQNLVPAIIALYSAASWGKFGIGLALFIFGGTLLVSILRYVTLRYKIENGELTVREGLIFKRVRTVPLKRIQNVDSTQNILHRLFRVAEVRVETAAGTEPEAKLRVLSLDKIAQLRNTVFGERTLVSAEGQSETSGLSHTDAVSSFPVAEPEVLHEITFKQLVRAGVASNRGVLVFGILIGAIFQFDLEGYFRENLETLSNFVPEGILSTVMTIVAALLLIFIATRLYGAIWYLQRFSGYRLSLVNDDFRISAGLFTKVSATVPQKRIQFISVHQSMFMRLFGLASIRIETAGGSGQESEDAASSMGRRWFIPVIEASKVDSMLGLLRPGLKWNPEQAEWIGVSGSTAKRLCRLAVIQSVLIAALGVAATRPWGWIAGLVVLPIFVYWALRKSKAMRYTETDFGVVYRSGVFTKKLSMTFFDRIQTLRFDQSPFDRRWKMATLSVDTAAAGPADHRVHVKYLDEAVARSRYDELTKRLAMQNW